MLGIRSAKHPHEVLFLLSTAVGATASMLAYNEAASPSVKVLGAVFGYILYSGLLVGSLVALYGVLIPNERGSVFERAGLFVLGMMLLAFALAVMARSGADATTTILWCLALSGSNLWRCQQIGPEIENLQAARKLLASRQERE